MVPAYGEVPVESFARLPLVGDLALSPDGKYLAAEIYGPEGYNLFIFEIIGNRLNITFAGKKEKDQFFRLKDWASPTRLLVGIGWEDKRYGASYGQTRLVALDYDGENMVKMVKQDIVYGWEVLQIQDRIIDFLTHDPDYILMQYSEDDPSRPGVHRVNIHTGKGRAVQGGKEGVLKWMTDRTGEVRLGEGGKRSESSWQYIVRDPGGKDWRTIYSLDFSSTTNFDPRGFSSNPNILYVASNHEGGPSSLYEYNVQENQYIKKIFGHPEVDIDGIWWDKRTWTPRCIYYFYNGLQRHWLDLEAKEELEKVEKLFPGQSVVVGDSSEDDSVWLLKVDSVTNSGGTYIINRRDRKIFRMSLDYPELEKVKLSSMHSFTYQARDGIEIPAYLSLPPDIESMEKASNLPLVVMPHGGPTSRDYARFDPFVQLMTSQGYAVLQMNFRGSSGYGKGFEVAGHKEWGRKMQNDVEDGVKHVIGKGIADPDRIAIFGISYGGYAALMGAVKTPDLYRCSVGVNGVYDLKSLVRDMLSVVGPTAKYLRAVIGDPSDPGLSPEARVDEIKIPVLLVAATDDITVPFDQTKGMAKVLRKVKADYEFLELDSGGHGLLTKESRLAFMKALVQFLDKHMK